MEKCSTCGLRDNKHAMNCTGVTPADYPAHFLRWVSTLGETVRRRDQTIRAQQHMLTFWQGKFAMVKHENNRLRKQLRDR